MHRVGTAAPSRVLSRRGAINGRFPSRTGSDKLSGYSYFQLGDDDTMTDVEEIDSPISEETATPRRRRRTGGASTAPTTTARRGRLSGADLIESLRESVEQLIKENRSLKRQLAKATAGHGSSSAPGAERTLRSIQRKVLRAVNSDGATRRRARTTAGTSRARSTAPSPNGRRRRATPTDEAGGE
jgi:hypothetical protein